MDSREMQEIIDLRKETPIKVGSTNTGHDDAELFRFSDGSEVIVTNAGVVAEYADGWQQLRSQIVS